MKKMIAVLMAAALMATASVCAFAVSPITAANGTDAKDVTAKYVTTTQPETYAVDVEWGAMQFTYTQGTQSWDAEHHKYVEDNSAKWTAEGNTVKVINHSSKEIQVTFTYEAKEADGVAGGFDKTGDQTIAKPVENGAASSVTATLTLTGKYTASGADFAPVGTATVTVK